MSFAAKNLSPAEVLRATKDLYNGQGSIEDVIKETAQAGAMAMRGLIGLDVLYGQIRKIIGLKRSLFL